MMVVIGMWHWMCVTVCTSRDRLLQADNLLASTNVYLLRGVIQLGRLLSNAPKDISSMCMSATDVWHTYVCCSALSPIVSHPAVCAD